MLLGLENKFSPEQLGIVASTALIWLAVENIIILFTRYLLVISSALRFYDTLAYSGYKFVRYECDADWIQARCHICSNFVPLKCDFCIKKLK